jgi:hypothetical protein
LAILQLKEEGYLDQLKKTWWYGRSECSSKEEKSSASKSSSTSALHLNNVAGIFYILIIGLGIAIIIAAIEILYKSRVDAMRSKVFSYTYISS